MVATDTPKVHTVQTLDIKKHTQIAAPPEIVWETLLQPAGTMGSMSLKIEPFPGGRWYRDLGNNSGHLWGHVQVIKSPTLLELCGPMMMSYPALNFIQYRLTKEAGGTLLALTHQAMGLLLPDHVTGVQKGWDEILAAIRTNAEATAKK
jgi:uncharacterized protein YndB with AHSA1/START domain